MIQLRLFSIIAFIVFLTPIRIFAVEFKTLNSKSDRINIQASFDTLDIMMEKTGKDSYRLKQVEGFDAPDYRFVGEPNLPRLNKLILIPPGKKVTKANYRILNNLEISGVEVLPLQSDVLENQEAGQAKIQRKASIYQKDGWYEPEFEMKEVARIGSYNVQPVTFTPAAYHPLRKKLKVATRFEVEFILEDSHDTDAIRPTTKFAMSQVKALALNSEASLVDQQIELRAVIVHSGKLPEGLSRLEQYYRSRQIGVTTLLVGSSESSSSVRNKLSGLYQESPFDFALILGDENHVRLHSWSNGNLGDSYYSFIAGNDYLADVSLARFPASNEAEAAYLMSKIEAYVALSNTGFINKKIMLAAHRENYPGKYTANQEQIRNAENPQGFEFQTRYGGAGASNNDVLDDINLGFGIVNYRGHGSSTTWSGWDRNGTSFGFSHVGRFENFNEKLTVFFNIACSNASIQNSGHTLVEEELFGMGADGESVGGVAALGATTLSYTETNHRFDKYLFKYLSEAEDFSLGNLNALANNQLVIDNGMSIPDNVKMYLLLGEPSLRPHVR